MSVNECKGGKPPSADGEATVNIMDRDELKSLLQSIEVPERQPGCPADEQVASYMEGGLSERDHREFETHLTDCAWCLERVGILGRALEHEAKAAVPDLALARARRMAGEAPEPGSRWRSAPGWVAAALVVLAIGLVARNQLPTGPEPAPLTQPEAVRTIRSIDSEAMGPGLLKPGEGIQVTHSNGAFNWTPVTDSLYYQVRIVTVEGDLLWQERVNETHWQLPSELPLTSGLEYFVRVDAHLSETRSLNSDYILFQPDE